MNLNLKILADGTICQQVLDSAGECRGFKRRNGEWIALEDAASGLGAKPKPKIGRSMHGNVLRGRRGGVA